MSKFKEGQEEKITDIIKYLDDVLHPIVSPDHWDVYRDLHDMISSLRSAQPEQKWIPCSERLPELDQEVLVYAIGKVDGFGDSVIAMSKRHIFRLFSSSEEGVEIWTSPWPYFSSNYEITHWMPLPEPPKGEQE